MPPDVQQLKEGSPLRATVSDLCLCIRNLVSSKMASQLKVVEMDVMPILVKYLANAGAPPVDATHQRRPFCPQASRRGRERVRRARRSDESTQPNDGPKRLLSKANRPTP
eukprot:9475296-Pyramimonas_sp.AAC.2